MTTLHGIWVTIFVSLFFIVYHKTIEETGVIVLLDQANWKLYFLGVFGGTLLSLRTCHKWGHKLGALSWPETVLLTKQQVLRLTMVLLAITFVTKDVGVSRLFLGSFLVFATVLIFISNRYLPAIICRIVFKTDTVPTLFIGQPEAILPFETWVNTRRNLGVRPVGYLSNEGHASLRPNFPCLGNLSRLEEILRENAIGQVVMIQNSLNQDEGKKVVKLAQKFGCRIRIYNNWEKEYEHPVIIDNDGDYTFLTLEKEPLENPVNRSVKRLLDIAIALPVVIFVLPPLILLVWFFQKGQAPGRVFYVQPRSGITKRSFNILKFRTMYDRTEDNSRIAEQATKSDDRIYPFGRFLRKTSLDEIPQFVNVLLGDMSVSGPRPHLVQHDLEFGQLLETYCTRHFVKPGITGLAQCKGFRGEISELELLKERIKYDIFYINNWSLLLEFQIIFLTARQIFLPPKSAY